jgi:hypothetical protein
MFLSSGLREVRTKLTPDRFNCSTIACWSAALKFRKLVHVHANGALRPLREAQLPGHDQGHYKGRSPREMIHETTHISSTVEQQKRKDG